MVNRRAFIPSTIDNDPQILMKIIQLTQLPCHCHRNPAALGMSCVIQQDFVVVGRGSPGGWTHLSVRCLYVVRYLWTGWVCHTPTWQYATILGLKGAEKLQSSVKTQSKSLHLSTGRHKKTHFKLSWHEVVDNGVDGWVEVAHAVSNDATVDEEDHDLLVGRRALR